MLFQVVTDWWGYLRAVSHGEIVLLVGAGVAVGFAAGSSLTLILCNLRSK